ncbi:MAG: phosphoribosylanthranilate isomerase [Clostridia bacterium]|nr:phosphoribosylanthranilate isomerase [Clostridia bacterium]
MTKIKLCGMSRLCDIEAVNSLMPDFIGFVFYEKSKRSVSFQKAYELSMHLNSGITPVGVFVDEAIQNIEMLVKNGTISAVQLHGHENDEYIRTLRTRIDCPIIQAFKIKSESDISAANTSMADFILLDSGLGSGNLFEHSLISGIKREFFLAGGINAENVGDAILRYKPYAADASSSLETDNLKDKNKMAAFVNAVRNADKIKLKGNN